MPFLGILNLWYSPLSLLWLKFAALKKIVLKYNQATLNKFEKILEESGYVVRYERGSFQSGYCILEDKKVVVLNKFLTPEGRINTLTEIIPTVKIDYDALTHESQKQYDQLMLQVRTTGNDEEAAP